MSEFRGVRRILLMLEVERERERESVKRSG